MDNSQIKDDDALEALFDAAKSEAPALSDDFLARLNADAEVAIPPPSVPTATPTPPLFGRLQGLFAASGLTGAAMLGIWIGFVMPETLNTMADGFETDDSFSISAILPGADLTVLTE